MEHLWSPWRLAYVTGTSKDSAGCIFCDVSAPAALGDGLERDDLVLVHGTACYVILNLYPYNNGHLMVVPRAAHRLACVGDGRRTDGIDAVHA